MACLVRVRGPKSATSEEAGEGRRDAQPGSVLRSLFAGTENRAGLPQAGRVKRVLFEGCGQRSPGVASGLFLCGFC